MTTMQNHFISRDTSNNWDAGLNTPNPRMAVMAMEDGFTMPSAAFKDSIPMTNYTHQELGVSPPAPTPLLSTGVAVIPIGFSNLYKGYNDNWLSCQLSATWAKTLPPNTTPI